MAVNTFIMFLLFLKTNKSQSFVWMLFWYFIKTRENCLKILEKDKHSEIQLNRDNTNFKDIQVQQILNKI